MTPASAYPPEPSEGRPPEPSMEDILASIRRIIADDQNVAGKAASPPGGARRPETASDRDRALTRARTPYDDVLDLARLVPSVDRPASQAVAPVPLDVDVAAYHGEAQDGRNAGDPSSGLGGRSPEPTARAGAQDEDHDMHDPHGPALGGDAEDDLLSPPLGESVMSAFETLAATVVLQNTPMLERVMRDLLRPMLKTWLDDNLPKLVERLVRTEIERVARGPRG